MIQVPTWIMCALVPNDIATLDIIVISSTTKNNYAVCWKIEQEWNDKLYLLLI